MTGDKDKTPGAELARRLSEVPADAQAALLFHLLENNATGIDDVLANREWTGGNSAIGNSGWPTHQDDRNESTEQGRTI